MKHCSRALFLAVVLLVLHYKSEARPAELSGPVAEQLQARFSDTVSELEWLLNQLVNILTEMTDGIEQDPSLLQNGRFRQILVQVIRRIDYILEHFENAGPDVLTGEIQRELTRIDCVRIRLANYISQSRRFDDRACRRMTTNMSMNQQGYNRPQHNNNNNNRPQNNNNNNNNNSNTDQILPLLTQIVSLLVQILNRLDSITSVNGNRPNNGGGHVGGGNHPQMRPTTRRPEHRPNWVASTINWDEMMGQFTTRPPMGDMPNWDQVFGSTKAPGIDNGVGTTSDWNDLINQVMGSMSSTLADPILITASTSRVTTPAPEQESTTNWEDAMNNLINQWNESMQSGNRSKRTIIHDPRDLEFNEKNIHSLIHKVREQMPELVY